MSQPYRVRLGYYATHKVRTYRVSSCCLHTLYTLHTMVVTPQPTSSTTTSHHPSSTNQSSSSTANTTHHRHHHPSTSSSAPTTTASIATTPATATATATTAQARSRQYSHLHAQLAQLNAHLADTENLLQMTAVQAEYVRGLGAGWGGA